MTTTFTVARKDLRRTAWVDADAVELAEGAVRMRIDAFALTSNNITYGAFGDAMRYWEFFPTADASMGCIPVWGFGRVVESGCESVPVGERYYGYFPMSDEALLQPIKVGDSGFTDGASHRRDLPGVYNRYLRCAADPLYDPGRESEQALLRPLFITSFLIDDFLADNDRFGARSVLLSSASSKTAYGTAFCLAARRDTDSVVRVIGLTSAANVAFCRDLKCYDEVLSYPEIGSLAPDVPTAYVDFSGSVPIRAAVHGHFGEHLLYSCSVGGTHWAELGSAKGLPGPRPVLFFAPAQVTKRQEDWGPRAFNQRLAAAWHAFMVPVTDASSPWLRVVRTQGRQAIESTFEALKKGLVPAREGHVLSV